MSQIYVIDREGTEHELSAEPTLSIMEIIRDAGLPVEAICGGQCVCTTCHVYVDEAWLDKLDPPSETEQVLVEDSGHYQENSRLSCQVPMNEALSGIRVTLAPEY